jgi:hypothetical protein
LSEPIQNEERDRAARQPADKQTLLESFFGQARCPVDVPVKAAILPLRLREIQVPVHVLDEEEITHDVPANRAAHAEMVVEQGLSFVAITQGNQAVHANDSAESLFYSSDHSQDTIALGAFYRSVVLARLRHQRATIIIDGGAHVGRSFCRCCCSTLI